MDVLSERTLRTKSPGIILRERIYYGATKQDELLATARITAKESKKSRVARAPAEDLPFNNYDGVVTGNDRFKSGNDRFKCNHFTQTDKAIDDVTIGLKDILRDGGKSRLSNYPITPKARPLTHGIIQNLDKMKVSSRLQTEQWVQSLPSEKPPYYNESYLLGAYRDVKSAYTKKCRHGTSLRRNNTWIYDEKVVDGWEKLQPIDILSICSGRDFLKPDLPKDPRRWSARKSLLPPATKLLPI